MRTVEIRGAPVSYVNAGFAPAYWGGFGFLPGMFTGFLLGEALSPGFGYPGYAGGYGDGDYDGNFGDGDFDGGDFGGGDFGGGDFGGGGGEGGEIPQRNAARRSSGRFAARWPCSRPVDWPTSIRYPSGSRM